MLPISVLASGGKEPALVDLDATIFIHLAIFVIMFVLLQQLLFKPVLRLIEARQNASDGARQEASQIEGEAKKLNDEYSSRLHDIRTSASAERDRVLEQARGREREIMASARAEIQKVTDQTKKETEAQATKVKETLKAQVTDLAKATATKVLGRQI